MSGHTVDQHTASAAVADEAGLRGVEGLASDSAMLVVKRGPNAGSRFLLDQPVTSAGRHPSSDVFLDDMTVSRRHAEFRQDSGEIRVVDIGSLNGTYVNRAVVDSRVLTNGDEIQMGTFRLVFVTTGTGLTPTTSKASGGGCDAVSQTSRHWCGPTPSQPSQET
jgi:pSer/pThr/pTyr-binding forkhead associated (FHA) protein